MQRMFRMAALVCSMSITNVAAASDLTGRASVIDGDTLEIHGKRVRLWGIDAPERGQLCRGDDSLQYRCGATAANELDRFINARTVACISVDTDRYGRTIASCSVENVDLAKWLVSRGLALDWPRFSKGKYDQEEREAEAAGVGIWGGSFVQPWKYRDCRRAGQSSIACSENQGTNSELD
jgi:endonuclease YncB( thermonuclease family)